MDHAVHCLFSQGFTAGNRQISHACPYLISQYLYIWGVIASLPAAFAMNHEAGPTFIQFALTQELHTFTTAKESTGWPEQHWRSWTESKRRG